jgi:hypothetical protein
MPVCLLDRRSWETPRDEVARLILRLNRGVRGSTSEERERQSRRMPEPPSIEARGKWTRRPQKTGSSLAAPSLPLPLNFVKQTFGGLFWLDAIQRSQFNVAGTDFHSASPPLPNARRPACGNY